MDFDKLIAASRGARVDGVNVFENGFDVPHIRAGSAPFVRPGDPEWRKPTDGAVLNVHVFDMAKPEDREAYTSTVSAVYTEMLANRAVINHIDRQFMEGRWLVYLEWLRWISYDSTQVQPIAVERARRE